MAGSPAAAPLELASLAGFHFVRWGQTRPVCNSQYTNSYIRIHLDT